MRSRANIHSQKPLLCCASLKVEPLIPRQIATLFVAGQAGKAKAAATAKRAKRAAKAKAAANPLSRWMASSAPSDTSQDKSRQKTPLQSWCIKDMFLDVSCHVF